MPEVPYKRSVGWRTMEPDPDLLYCYIRQVSCSESGSSRIPRSHTLLSAGRGTIMTTSKTYRSAMKASLSQIEAVDANIDYI